MSEAPSALNLEITTDDRGIADLCKLYWMQTEDGKYLHSVRELASLLGTTVRETTQLISCNSAVRQEVGRCRVCGKAMFRMARSRTDLQQNWRCPQDRACEGCEAEIQRALQEQRLSEEAEKNDRMNDAFERSAWHSLKPLELNLLIEIVRSNTLNEAFRKVGLSDSRGNAIFELLEQMDLIGVKKDENRCYFHDGLRDALAGLSIQRRVKSIFGSPQALELYRALKREHAFVFPEIPVCAFIERSGVAHLFTEAWHEGYFLTCRVDFLVCDAEGKPMEALEYQGSYHSERHQRRKDEFKRQLLEEAGLSIHEVNGRVAAP